MKATTLDMMISNTERLYQKTYLRILNFRKLKQKNKSNNLYDNINHFENQLLKIDEKKQALIALKQQIIDKNQLCSLSEG